MSTAAAGAHRTGDLGQRLGHLIEQAWDNGWEPMDLHRVAVRNTKPAAIALLGDLIAADLARYAALTVEERWHAQLDEMEASVWWRPDEDPVTARARLVKGGWAALHQAGRELEAWLRGLPALEVIGARPGRASARKTPGPAVDERLLGKVRLMLAKAESTTFPEEAETFTAAAQKLMTRHSIDRALLEQGKDSHDGPAAIRVGVDRPYESARFHLISAIATANRCKAVWQKGLGFSTVVGFPTDLRAVELLFTSLMVQATSAMAAAGSREHWSGQNRTRSFRNSFLTAFAVRIGERLDLAAQQAQQEGEQERAEVGHLDPGVPGGSASRLSDPPRNDRTALVLAARDKEVEDAVAERFPRLQTQRSRATLDAEGWVSGTTAADRADLGAPGRLGRTGS
ncbi:DUF2786 domain-containing protein [Ornithinimicrobium faecis]|uniref:DUF2786 domain-containing protein n=1 Tax=Ornithinimicrobium faecis TaxID=2934158 RepID=A0ABY4YQL4_9MICO|nr:DUF2786 domain-containing protein [Ornithinimicrobium sp. HY1793]USQ78998.1 DUF2786 domain-containing protein [Ornithinimicrobium sp. HY1793]